MTMPDYVGVVMTIVIFLLMAAAYVYAFSPKNKERFDTYRHIPLNDEEFKGGKEK